MSTYSANLRLELIGTGEQQGSWGVTTNTNLGTLLEEAIGGYISVAVTDGADTTLTTANGSADQSRNMTINLTGALTATRNVICPAIEKIYVVKNATTGGFAITFKVTGQTGVSIPNGSACFVYVNGTDAFLVNGTIATQNSNNIAITGGSITGITDLAVADGGTGASSASTARTNLGAASLGANSDITSLSGLTTPLSIAQGGTASNTAANARTALGLGSIATQNSNTVSITGGSVTGITDLVVADGGTGVSSITAYAVLTGGTTSTGAVQTVASVGSAGQILTSNGAGALPSFQTVSATGRLLRAPQTLTSGTSYTTPAGCSAILVQIVGGGGGCGYGTGVGGAGGTGGYAEKYFSVSPSTAYTYAIGAGGVGENGPSTASGAAGGSTTITVSAVTVTAGGGGGGGTKSSSSAGVASGGTGGTCTNGDLNTTGNTGGYGLFTYVSGSTAGNLDGMSFNSVLGSYGRGGSANTGKDGISGVIRIYEFS